MSIFLIKNISLGVNWSLLRQQTERRRKLQRNTQTCFSKNFIFSKAQRWYIHTMKKITEKTYQSVGNKSWWIVVDKEEEGIFKGLQYYGDKENYAKATSGHVNSYFEISGKLKPCSEILKPDIQQERRLLLTELIKTNKEVSLWDAGFKL